MSDYVNKISVLDVGFVEYVNHMGSDLTVVDAARVSFNKKTVPGAVVSDALSELCCMVCGGVHLFAPRGYTATHCSCTGCKSAAVACHWRLVCNVFGHERCCRSLVSGGSLGCYDRCDCLGMAITPP